MWPPSRPHSSTCSVDDRRLTEADQERFSSAILPRYARRAPSVDNLIPTLYLKGVSSGDFSEALQAILGEGAGLSATNVVRPKAAWGQVLGGRDSRERAPGRRAQLHPGDHGCRRARQQGTGGRQRRVSGEHRLLARDAAGPAAARPYGRAAIGDRRRRVGLLGGAPGSIPRHRGT